MAEAAPEADKEVHAVRIRIEPAAVIQAQTQLRQQYSTMQTIGSNISSVMNGLDMQIAATEQIRQSLDSLWRKSSAELTMLESMSHMLADAGNRFTETDQKLGRRAKGLNNSFDSVMKVGAIAAAVALKGIDQNLKVSELNQAFGLAASPVLHNAVGTTSKKNRSDTLLDGIIGFGRAAITKGKKLVSAAKKNYENHGAVYDAVQYGKAALKIGKGVVKIVGAVGAISTGVGIPIAICGIISAGNDIINASVDMTHVALDQYDEVGKANYLKDLLKKNGGELGTMLGNRSAGEKFGELAYTGLDLVSFLNGADKMLKSFGKVNTDLTGKTGYSFVWGKTSFDDVIGNEFKWYKPDELIRSRFMDADSTANFVIEAAKSVKSVYKSGKKYVDEFFEIAFK